MYARFQSCPKESQVAKRILIYLNEMGDPVLVYPLSDNFDLIKYDDSDYAGYLVDRDVPLEWFIFLDLP